ncbi:MAG: DMT family transporter [Deltaproteobacteria bacterium]|nr:DMT family transporter [Deltaproteobacteria bacterium]
MGWEKGKKEDEWSILSLSLAAFLSAAFGANAVAIKMSLTGIGPFTAAGLRFLIASLTIFIWARATGRSIRVQRDHVFTLFLLWLLFVCQMSLMYYGIHMSNASRATLITNLQPFFVLFLARLLIHDERISLRKIVGLFLSFGGVCFLFLEREGAAEQFRTGDLLIVFTTFLWALSSAYTKRVIHIFSPYIVVLYPMLFSVPFFFLEGFLWDARMIGDLNAKVVAALLYQALVAASFGFIAWNTLLQRHGAVVLNSFNFIMPIAGVFLGWWLLEEPMSVNIWLALGLVTAGIVVIQTRNQ